MVNNLFNRFNEQLEIVAKRTFEEINTIQVVNLIFDENNVLILTIVGNVGDNALDPMRIRYDGAEDTAVYPDMFNHIEIRNMVEDFHARFVAFTNEL